MLWGQGPAEPARLVSALLDERERLAPLTVLLGTVLSERLTPARVAGLSLKGFIGMGPAAALIEAGALDVLPCSTSDIPRLIARRALRVDAVLLQVSPPDRNGNHSLGLVADYLSEAIDVARVVVAEVNPRVPFTLGDSIVHASRLDATVHSKDPLIEVPARPHRPAEKAIAEHVAALIPDGATLQIGIGQTPDAILDGLWEKKDLGIHSGMITDRVAALMEAWVITNRRKAIDVGQTVTGTLFGTENGLYRYADRNPLIQMRPAVYTHDAGVLARLDRFMAINGAVEVDCTGQINTEAIGANYVGAVGGQLDFARGALSAARGRSIVALSSTSSNGARSRIVPLLETPVVSIPRSCADCVVTEFGVAELRGRSVRERAERLLKISHPDFRDELSENLRDLA